MSLARTDFYWILVNISVIRNELEVFVDVPSQDTDFHRILVIISVFRNEFKEFVDVPTHERFPWDSC
jgi:hypothetical protein